eukprot:2823133-Karenia_brevis.AAC.1
MQKPTNLDVRRLNTITRKLQQKPAQLVIQGKKCKNVRDIHTDSGYRRIDSADDIQGYGMR